MNSQVDHAVVTSEKKWMQVIMSKGLPVSPSLQLLVEDLVAMPGQTLKAALHLWNSAACLNKQASNLHAHFGNFKLPLFVSVACWGMQAMGPSFGQTSAEPWDEETLLNLPLTSTGEDDNKYVPCQLRLYGMPV